MRWGVVSSLRESLCMCTSLPEQERGLQQPVGPARCSLGWQSQMLKGCVGGTQMRDKVKCDAVGSRGLCQNRESFPVGAAVVDPM